MHKLRAYLNSLSSEEQTAFAARCKTTVGYLRKAVSQGQALREALCIDLERESRRAVCCEDLRPDVDWAYLRNGGPLAVALAPSGPGAIAARAM